MSLPVLSLLLFSIGFLIFWSALFSGLETALFSLKSHQLRGLEESHPSLQQFIQVFRDNPRRVLNVLLLADVVVNVPLVVLCLFLIWEGPLAAHVPQWLAATTLAAQRTGAIIVIEREMGLRSYVETGIALDAIVTYDLLISIFNPGTPLHDGAVVIQGNRCAAAACFLPLTVNPELSRTLGSRHRAAIGVTEDTDAVAVVVSEETRIISLVAGGQIRRELDGRVLKQALLEALEVEEDEASETAAQTAAPVREK
jgi:hypothetical protein